MLQKKKKKVRDKTEIIRRKMKVKTTINIEKYIEIEKKEAVTGLNNTTAGGAEM